MKKIIELTLAAFVAISSVAYSSPVRKGRLPADFAPDSVSLRPLVECTVRDGLPNFFKKIHSGQKVINVVYLGGSITDQDGYRVKSCEYLQSQYPDVRFNGIKSSIGGTGSYLGALRCGHDVVAHNPDLVVVEFAVNDGGGSPKGIMRSMEGIVRQIWAADPYVDILFVYTLTDGSPIKNARKGHMSRSASADEVVADYYGIPSVHMGVEVARLSSEGKLVMKGEKGGEKMVFSPDGVHPYIDTGHELYTQSIVRSLPLLSRKSGLRHHKLYDPIIDNRIEKVTTAGPEDLRLNVTGNMKRYEGGCPELDYFSGLTDLHVLDPGTELSFKFKGTDVILYDILGPEGVILDIIVDGIPVEEQRFDSYCSYSRLSYCTVAKKMDPEKMHTVTVRVTEKPIDKRSCLGKGSQADYDGNPEKYSPKRYYLGKIFIIGDIVEDQPELLYNGIEIPAQWPPRYKLPNKPYNMPVPYLEHRPSVIDTKVGRQLFVDDFLIDQTDMERVAHQARMYEGNPVIGPDKPWEYRRNGSYMTMTFSGGLFYDETDNLFKAWYLSGEYTLGDGYFPCYCYAESSDGKHWTKPELDIIPGTNIVDTIEHDSQAVWLDKFEKDPAKRFKSVYVATKDSCVYDLKYSSDGIHWSETKAQSIGRIQDRSTVMYNPFRKKWIASLRICSTKENLRSRAYMEDEDLERLVRRAHWVQDELDYVRDSSITDYVMKDKDIVYWFTSEPEDYRHPFPEIAKKFTPAVYNFDATAYESVMMGQYAVWRGPENHVAKSKKIQKLNEFCLGFSRDGFHYYRPSHIPVMESVQEEGVWNWGNMQAAIGNPIIVGDSLYLFCSGHMRNDDDWDGCATTGLGIMRRDGFVSMDASGEGYLLTQPLTFDGDYFFVNACAEALSVEILDQDGKPIKGFSKEDCIALRSFDSTKIQVTWKGGRHLKSLAGKPVRVRFHLTGGQLYSFWVSPWQTGESRGYLGGGGPGLNPSGIDEPF